MKRHRLPGYAGLLLAAFALLGRGTAAVDGFAPRLPLLLGAALAATVAAVVEFRALRGADALAFDRGDAADFLAVVAGAVLTYWLSVDAGFGPVVASAVVGLAAGVALPRVDSAAYCGSFVGMVSPAVFPDAGLVVAAGAAAGALFVAARGAFDGFGGKLGTTAFFGILAVAAGTAAEFAAGTAPPWSEAALLLPVTAVAAALTVALGFRYGLGSVIASAAVGLFGGLVLPMLHPAGDLLATAAFCATFVGMVAPARIDGELRVGAAGALSGAVFLAVSPVFAGAGGKLGTTAFVSCLACYGVSEGYERLRSP
ncbi:hypothetical protein [Halolamina salifodinae]|uniref:Uncharacterized protein n=1 Tax=Halolamina salifodinae TaxID=1202767 RepID=A0A8T4GVU9_9EURY|nr:hypothetical protein [Halolamina salifodinae]MBP1987046.1 hypothetical protein [Halolamina salifodinae]